MLRGAQRSLADDSRRRSKKGGGGDDLRAKLPGRQRNGRKTQD
jgi:hypothetical protein